MFVILSERKMTALIRELEGLGAETQNEILVRMDYYGNRLFSHLRKFGVSVDGLNREAGDVAGYHATLSPSHTEDHRHDRVRGLVFLRPVCITMEASDIPALILNPMMQAAARESWVEIAGEFERILPEELMDKIERVVPRVAFGPRPAWKGPANEVDFQMWLSENGLKDPSGPGTRHLQQIEADQEAEEQRRQAAYERWTSDENEGNFSVREL